MKKLNRKTVENIVFGTGVVLGSVAVIVVLHHCAKNMHILKEARWTPEGDMLLTFYHRSNSYLIPKPE